ncbi:BT1A1 protein, partial [Brachypodius atriceps]|nr:BT1A1 protein [Brachypodius atriceps]
ASVTLDPDTAHPELELSQDGKRVWRGAGHRPPPPRPERFDHWPFVLGHQRFVSGRHCWAVDVGDGGDWAVGVARDSVRRKGRLSLGPPGGIWGLEKWGGQLRALTARKRIPLFPARAPSRVRVALDYDRGQVAFFDADKRSLIFAFPAASFEGRRVHPWFLVWGEGARIALCP